jgi:hypothetical protein
VLCAEQQRELATLPTDFVNNCQMFVEHNVASGQITFITLQYDKNVNIAVQAITPSTLQDISIESDELILSYNAENSLIENGVLFTLTDKKTGEENPLGLSIRFWSSS